MTDRPNDALLRFGKAFALILQGVCALAGGVALLLIPIVPLASQDMLPEFLDLNDLPIIEASPLSVFSIALMLAMILAALFYFFGKMRALIKSVGEGDPFIPENARRLNAMAWLLLGVQVLTVLVGGLRLYLVNLVDDAANGRASIDVSFYDLDGMLMVIILFILARVFRHGAAMRDDLEGTV
ncbi:DUF2975 domain-containing protein [Pelagerythrobacter sp.]|uniref:DUF2975 domain-containing protein n=1 Tax=Pelagerythrobacter sp. TaxID=2800702 RepID=UPI0035AEF098